MRYNFLRGLAGAVIAIVLSSMLPDLFRQWEWKTVDWRFEVRGPIRTDDNLVLIDADDASAAVYGQWPWKRSVHAEMIDFLKEAGARTTAYDVLFAHPGDAAEDSLLVQSVKNAGNVVFPVAVGVGEPLADSRAGTSSEAALDLAEMRDSENLKSPSVPLYKGGGKLAPLSKGEINSPLWQRGAGGDLMTASESIQPFSGFADTGVMTGHIAANRDADGVIRRVPLLIRHKGKLLPALGLRVVLAYLNVPPANVEVGKSSIVLKQARLPGKSEPIDIHIPIDAHGQMPINFAGRWGNTFKRASFASVLAKDVAPAGKGEDLSGKLVLVSNTLSGHDIKPTPFEKDYPGSGIHANIINTILTRNFLRETHKSTDHSIILLLCLATAVILGGRRYPVQAVLLCVLIAAYIGLGIVAFRKGIVIPLFLPVFSIALTATLASLYRANVEKGISGDLLKEKRAVESHLQSIAAHLGKKERELEKIQGELASLRQGMDRDRDAGKVQAEKIDELQAKLQTVIGDKVKLQAERVELENKVLDLRVHIIFDGPAPKDIEGIEQECGHYGIITRNRAMFEMFRVLKQVAGVPSSVLILGDSGTGKELFAKALHALSGRSGEFVALNMGAIPDGLVESELFGHVKGAFTGAVANSRGKFALAHKGTVFLDEIGEIKNDIQVKLLRVLQEKEILPVGGGMAISVDVRVAAATNKDLEKAIRGGNFREDLFYRLNTITLKLPPLRDRREDIEILALHFLEKYRTEYGKKIQGISDKAMKKLLEHDWPGNIRELENVIQRGITLAAGELIQEKDLGLKPVVIENRKPEMATGDPSTPPLSNRHSLTGAGGILSAGDALLLNALRDNNFEINPTATQLKMSRNTVASRFKGICFDLLARHQQDREKAACEISDNESHRALLIQKIAEYHDNLIKNGLATEEEAIDDALRRSKNVPARHYPAIRELMRQSFINR